jgi:endonuclease-8
MTGSWHLYRPGERWWKPAHRAVAVIRTEAFIAPCFSAPVVELLTRRQAARHPDLVGLGSDAITVDFDAKDAKARLRRYAEAEIGVALMNQRILAGVGNVFKSEVLFLRRLSPFAKVGTLPEAEIDALLGEAHRLLLANRTRGERVTRSGLDRRERLWVYGRSGEPCPVCGTTLRMRRQGLDARSTYYCPACQSGP